MTRVDLDPRPLGGIGRVGYFRANAVPLWSDALDWFRSLVEIIR